MKIAGIVALCAALFFGGWYVIRSGSLPSNTTVTTQTESKTTGTQGSTAYTYAQVSAHNSASDCWMVINGTVYDVTSYVPEHPGSEILRGCGKEATAMYEEIRKHEGRATAMLPSYKIGVLAQ